MGKKHFIFVIFIVLCSCERYGQQIQEFAENEFSAFPESRFVDIYKSFFQDAYGPGHIIPDTTLAGKYVDEDLVYENWPDTILYQATGINHDYYRINLVLVKNGTISRDTLLMAMVRSAKLARNPEIGRFKTQVNELYTVVKKLRPDLPDLEIEKAAIDANLANGVVMAHHSEHYLQTYQRRYRIIHQTIFEKWKNNFLQK